MANANRDQLDAIDRRIVDALVEDGRMSFRAIGERIGLASDAARDRYIRLRDQGIVRVVGIPQLDSLGFRTAASIGLSVSGPVSATIQRLEKIPDVAWIAATFGLFDIMFEIVGIDDQELFEKLDMHVRGMPGVRSCNVLMFANVYKWNTRPTLSVKSPQDAGRLELSEEDKRIITALQQDGRMPFKELAEICGLNYAQARRRAKLMLENGVVRISTSINRPALGSVVMAAVVIRVQGGSALQVAAALAADSRIEIVMQTLGTFDLLLEVVCASHAELLNLVNEEIKAIPGVAAVETNLYARIERPAIEWDADALMMAIKRPRD